MGQDLPRPGDDRRGRRPARSSRHHLRDERRELPPARRARTQARPRPAADPRDNLGQCLIVAARQSTTSIPLARQSRSAVLSGYVELAQSVGLDPYQMVAAHGFPPACLTDPELKIPLRAVARLLEDSAARSDGPTSLSGWRSAAACPISGSLPCWSASNPRSARRTKPLQATCICTATGCG